jgi:uncharacterized PurR-regulated membrane protein YhhQ (DUF165 family)
MRSIVDFRIVFNKVTKVRKNNTPEIVEYPQMIDSSSRKRQYINPEEPVTPVEPRNFISYPYMIAIMSVLQVLTALYNRHFITFFGYDISFGSLLLFPWVIFIFQISAECYGWQYARQIVWCNFIVNGITTAVTFTAKFIGYSSLNHATMKAAYITLVDTMWVACAMSWMVIFISDYITSALTSWSRIKFNGRFLILRTVVLNIISESILLSSSFIILPFNGYSIENTVHTFYSIFLARAIMSIMLLPIVRCIIWYIQHRIEHVVVFDYKKDFNPFKFAVNLHDAIQFDTKEWNIMPNTLKKNFNFARAMMIYQSTHAICRFTVK